MGCTSCDGDDDVLANARGLKRYMIAILLANGCESQQEANELLLQVLAEAHAFLEKGPLPPRAPPRTVLLACVWMALTPQIRPVTRDDAEVQGLLPAGLWDVFDVFEAVLERRGWRAFQVSRSPDIYVEAMEYVELCRARLLAEPDAQPLDREALRRFVDSVVRPRFEQELTEAFLASGQTEEDIREYLSFVTYERARRTPRGKLEAIARNWPEEREFTGALARDAGEDVPGAVGSGREGQDIEARVFAIRKEVVGRLCGKYPGYKDLAEDAADDALIEFLTHPRNYRFTGRVADYVYRIAVNLLDGALRLFAQMKNKAQRAQQDHYRAARDDKEAEKKAKRVRRQTGKALKDGGTVEELVGDEATELDSCEVEQADMDPNLESTDELVHMLMHVREMFLLSVLSFQRDRRGNTRTRQWPIFVEVVRLRLRYRYRFNCLPSMGLVFKLLEAKTGVKIASPSVVARRLRLRMQAIRYVDKYEIDEDLTGDESVFAAVEIAHRYATGSTDRPRSGSGAPQRKSVTLEKLELDTIRRLSCLVRAAKASGAPDLIAAIMAQLLIHHRMSPEEAREWLQPLIDQWEKAGPSEGQSQEQFLEHLIELRSLLDRAQAWLHHQNRKVLERTRSQLSKHDLGWATSSIWLLCGLGHCAPEKVPEILRLRDDEYAPAIAAAEKLRFLRKGGRY